MIRKMSEEHQIKFLNEITNSLEKEKENISNNKKDIKVVAEEQKAKSLNNKDNGLMTSKNIASARTGVIGEEGGPNKHIKMESSNSLWDIDKTQRLSNINDNKTKTKIEKDNIVNNKRVAEQKRMDDLVESLRTTNLEKSSNIFANSPFSGSNYKNPTSNISIFDNDNFERLAEKTRGEEIVEENKNKRSQKDQSWKNSGKTTSSRDITNRLFDSLFNKE